MDAPQKCKKQSALIRRFSDWRWRMDNLYFIRDKTARIVRFRANSSQRKLLDDLHGRDIILKARQLGFSTVIDLFLLDNALFAPGFRVGIVADTEDTAKELLATKVRLPYEHLPARLQGLVNLTTDSTTSMEFTNGSCIHVGVTLRAGTYNAVHVSEFGKISVESPDKAEEVVSGTLETVPTDGMIFIESTARGRSGLLYEWWTTAVNNVATGRELSNLDYKPHFFPWYANPEYLMVAPQVVIPERLEAGFAGLPVTLSREQKCWYASKESQLGDSMLREYPSTPDEAFQAALQGVYWEKELRACRQERVGKLVYQSGGPGVDTWWDLGQADDTAIWFTQDIGHELHILDFHEQSGEGFEFYAQVLRDKGYRYRSHYAPHDIKVREFSGKSRWEQALAAGIRFEIIPRVQNKQDSVQAVRSLLPHCFFDESRCAEGLKHLESYRREWDDVHGIWKNKPYHDVHSNAADAFQQLAMGHVFGKPGSAMGLANKGAR